MLALRVGDRVRIYTAERTTERWHRPRLMRRASKLPREVWVRRVVRAKPSRPLCSKRRPAMLFCKEERREGADERLSTGVDW